MKFLSVLLVLIFSPYGELTEKKRDVPPHIIIIVIDDLGETENTEERQDLQIIITKFLPPRLERCVLEQPRLAGNTSGRARKVKAGEL